MPLYNYTTSGGVTVQRLCPMSDSRVKATTVLPTDEVIAGDVPIGKVVGRMATRNILSEHSKGQVCNDKLWPKFSESLSVNPSQAGELREHLAEHNVDADVRSNGDVYVSGPKNMADHAKLRGFVDRGRYY